MSNKNTKKKYTINVNRNIWTNSNLKIINPLVKILTKMFSKFHLEYDTSVFADISFYDTNDSLIENKKIIVELKENMSYAIVGGIAYNLLYKQIANIDLNNFVDHTSDIDILINDPVFIDNNDINEIIKNDEINTYLDGVITDKDGNKKINCFYENYSRKLYNTILESLNNENIDMMSNTTNFDLNEYSEYRDNIDAPDNIFLHNEIENAHLIRIYNSRTENLKIQLVLKVETVIDHIFEIIIKCGRNNWSNLTKPETNKFYTIVDKDTNTNINIQNIKGLLTDNFNAYNDRKQMLDVIELNGENYYHKPINHIGRLLYLLFLFKNMRQNSYIKENMEEFCITFMAGIKMFLYKNKNKVDTLKYFIIKKSKYGYDIIDIKIIDIIKAFIDVFYNISSDGLITKKVKNMYDIYFFNNKNIKEIFENDVFLNKFDSNKPFINSQYDNINNIINENIVVLNVRSKFKNLIKELKTNRKTIKKHKNKLNIIMSNSNSNSNSMSNSKSNSNSKSKSKSKSKSNSK